MTLKKNLQNQVGTFVLAGGRGVRLFPLTAERPKPLVPHGGVFRAIDFVLSNCQNSGLGPIHVLTQHRREQLHAYFLRCWNDEIPGGGPFVRPIGPARGRTYAGTANAVVQNLVFFQTAMPENFLVLSADHVYKMDYRDLIRFHEESGADVTVSTVEHPRSSADRFGIVEAGAGGRVNGFEEKPARPKALPEDPELSLVSMGVYVFRSSALQQIAHWLADRAGSVDLGRDVLPRAIEEMRVFAYRFRAPSGRPGYWRDIGTIDSFHHANMELLGSGPDFDPYSGDWPVRVTARAQGWQKEALSEAGSDPGVCSIIPHGALTLGAEVYRSVLSPGVTLERGARVQQSILMPGATVGRGASIRRAVIDAHAEIGPNEVIGYDIDRDRARFPTMADGIVVVPSSYRSGRPAPVRHFPPVTRAVGTGGISSRRAAAS